MTTSSISPLIELVRLNRRFGVLLAGGAAIPDALRALAAEASPGFQLVIARVLAGVEAGGSFTEPLNDFPEQIPAIYREWVRFGEETGTLDSGAREVAELLEPVAKGGGDRELGWGRIEEAVSLIQFTRRSAELLEKGLEWWRVLVLLTHEAPPNFAEMVGEMLPRRDDQRGWLTLWQRMDAYPQVFSPFYRAVVRLGWEAHAMEESMRGLAELLFEDWRLTRLNQCYSQRASHLIDHGAPPAAAWTDLTRDQQQLVTVLFCRAASLLLTTHDPADALAACALLLPVAERERMLASLQATDTADLPEILDGLGCFPPFVLTLVTCGQSRGRVEYALTQAANVVQAEME